MYQNPENIRHNNNAAHLLFKCLLMYSYNIIVIIKRHVNNVKVSSNIVFKVTSN